MQQGFTKEDLEELAAIRRPARHSSNIPHSFDKTSAEDNDFNEWYEEDEQSRSFPKGNNKRKT